MKAIVGPLFRRFFAAAAAAFMLVSLASCSTTYDAYGRPVQSVDPALAVAGIAAAGLIGYAIADSRDDHHYYGNRGYGYAPAYHSYGGGYRGGYGGYRGGNYCRY